MPRTATQDIKCQITSQMAALQTQADQRRDPTLIARIAKSISAQIDQYYEWTDSGRGWVGCGPYHTSRQIVDQLSPLLLLGMARMTRTEAVAERTRESGIRTAVDTAGSVQHQILAEEVRQTARPQPDLATQLATRAGQALTGTAPAAKNPPEPTRVDFTKRVKSLEGQRRSISTDYMISSAQRLKDQLRRIAIWSESCGLFTPGCSGRYDSSVSLNSRLGQLIGEARKKQAANASAAERAAAERREAARREAESAASRERIAAAQVASARTAAERAAAEKRRIAALRQRDAARAETERQRQAQEAEMRRRRAQQSSGVTAKEFRSAAEGIGTILGPLSAAFSNITQQRVAFGQQQLAASQRGRGTPQYIYAPQPKKKTGLIIAAVAGGSVILLLILFLALR